MDRDTAIQAEKALDFLDTYNYPKIKEAVHELRNVFQPMIEKTKQEKAMRDNNLKWSYKMFEPHVKVAQAIELFNRSISLYEEAADNLEKTQGATQDILHAIELCELDEDEMLKLVRDLHEIRRIRREAKDFTDIMLPMYNLAYKYRDVTSELTRIQGEMNRLAQGKENRKYNPREKTELKEKFQAAQ